MRALAVKHCVHSFFRSLLADGIVPFQQGTSSA